MVAGGCCEAAHPRETSPQKTLHPAVAIGHGGMESGDMEHVRRWRCRLPTATI